MPCSRMYSACAEPLSNYPSSKQMYQLHIDQWHQLGTQLRLTTDQLEEAKKNSNPTAAVLLAAKVTDIDLSWSHIIEALLRVGEYKLTMCVGTSQQPRSGQHWEIGNYNHKFSVCPSSLPYDPACVTLYSI